jgi:hypothetical protein
MALPNLTRAEATVFQNTQRMPTLVYFKQMQIHSDDPLILARKYGSWVVSTMGADSAIWSLFTTSPGSLAGHLVWTG